MQILVRMEEQDDLKLDAQRIKSIRNFNREINNTYDKNLEECLDKFIDKYETEESDITHKLRMFVQYIKDNNIK